ncbi:MAG: hypothetical protein L6Q98_23510 [Anaerolineae bacterium]|nr:hypothetical protein [Anaerolineae bacterium]NUQ06378.1 hypothetical protein [Anaerolineae bacterium]
METTMKLAILAQVVAETGDPITTMERIGEALGALYQDAEDVGNAERALAISETWGSIDEYVGALADQGQRAIDLAVSAREMTEALSQQRNAALAALEDKLRSIRSMNVDDDDVGQLVETVEEMVLDGIAEYDYDNRADEFVEGLLVDAEVQVSQDDAYELWRILTGNDAMLIDDGSRMVLLGELSGFIKTFISRWHEAERRHG